MNDVPPPPPTGAELAAAVRFLKAGLARNVPLPRGQIQALAEAPHPQEGSGWFQTDGNAKALELLAQPQFWNGDPGLGGGVLDFVLALSPGATMFRRCAWPQITLLEADPRAFRIQTSFHEFTGDLSRGILRQRSRGRDEPGQVEIHHTGNMVQFQFRGRRHSVDIEESVSDYGITRLPGRVVLHHESRIEVPAGVLRSAPQRIGHVRYTYTLSAEDPLLRLQVSLRPEPEVALSRVRLTTALDELGAAGPGTAFRRASIGTAGAAPRLVEAGHEGQKTLHSGPAEGIALHGSQSGRLAPAIHLRPGTPAALKDVLAVGRGEQAGLHWFVLRHAAEALGPGEGFEIAEDRLLTMGGGAPAQVLACVAAAAALAARRDALPGIDPSPSRDPGAALNGVATVILGAMDELLHPAPAEARVAELRAWYDRHLEAFFAATLPQPGTDGPAVFLRGLAFVTLSLDTMLQATGLPAYRAHLEAALDLLLARQQTGAAEGSFVEAEGKVSLDGHAAALLALARLACRPNADGRVVPALRRGLAAIRLGTADAVQGGRTLPVDTLAVRAARGKDGGWAEDAGLRTSKVALLLRALRGALAAQAAGRLPLDEWELGRARRLAALCQAQIAASRRDGPRGTEYLTGPFSGKTDPETQAWCALALLGAEAELAWPPAHTTPDPASPVA